MNVIPVTPPESLYQLTPAIYRIADAQLGEPLRALMGVLEGPYRQVEENIEALYDDWFIETCAPWLVPYIGELVGVRASFDPSGVIPTVRARVANALAYSRRKGSAWVLAQAVGDATGWPARAVEFWELLSQTQDLGDVRPRLGRTADLRLGAAVEAGTPFDWMAHTVEVRGADANGRWAADRVGLSLWRLGSYPVTASQPRPVAPGCYTFDPFGVDTQLFLPPRTHERLGAEPPPWDVPGPISRELLALGLDDVPTRPDPWKTGEYPMVAVLAGAGAASASPLRIVAAGLDGWRVPVVPRTPWETKHGVPVAVVDPERGRLALVGPQAPWVRVDWSYGFSADLGGGPYARAAGAGLAPPNDAFVAWVGETQKPPGKAVLASSVEDALAQWAQGTALNGVVVIQDSATYPLPQGVVAITPARRLWIVAAAGHRPCLSGSLWLAGVEQAGVFLSGVLLDGTVRLSGPVDLTASDCTLAPPVDGGEGDARRSVVGDSTFTGTISISRSIVGPLMVPEHAGDATLSDSILAGGVYAMASGSSDADAGTATALTVRRSTVFGLVRARTLSATDSIFADPVLVDDATQGGLTCCYVLPAKGLPHRDRCQPQEGSAARPIFTSRRFGDAGFAQLADDCPASIRTGASDGAEMGAFHLLDNPRRLANLNATIAEFLPNGLEVVRSYIT